MPISSNNNKKNDLEKLYKELQPFGFKASNDIIDLISEYKHNGFTLPNRIVALPMEGVDAIDNIPSELTIRKYKRIAKGGYGMIWVEATSVNDEGKSNDNQLMITKDNVNDFKNLNEIIKEYSIKSLYKKEAFTVLQLNHSGRYSNKNKKENAIIASHRPQLDKPRGIESDRELVSDEYLTQLKYDYLNSARLASNAGFDAVDIKACHGYLISELLSAKDREGEYGGDFESRIKFLLDTIKLIKNDEQCKKLEISVRLNMADLTENGFATNYDLTYDLTETKKLISELYKNGINLISLTLGNPYFIPNKNKPFDLKKNDNLESPLDSSIRILKMSSELQNEFPQIDFVGLGYTWFKDLGPNIAESLISSKLIKLVGFGRQILSYPDLPNDLLNLKKSNKDKMCTTCGHCSKLKSNFLPAGCVVRDREVYGKYYNMIRGKI